MNPRGLKIFKHNSKLGNAPSHTLLESVSIRRKDGVAIPRAFKDFVVKIDREQIPAGVEIIERI